MSNNATQWRAVGPYTASSTATAGLLFETQLFLNNYAKVQGTMAERAEAARQALVGGVLNQRSRAARVTVAGRIIERLVRWNPPAWVLDDMVGFTQEHDLEALKATFLVHVCRQDILLYNIVQKLVYPRWRDGERQVRALDVHQFLDDETPLHSEIEKWSYATRNRLATNKLSTLRDFGLLRGGNSKEIVEPVVPQPVIRHLVTLLRDEGIAPAEIPFHPDWQLLLWTPERSLAATRQVLD